MPAGDFPTFATTGDKGLDEFLRRLERRISELEKAAPSTPNAPAPAQVVTPASTGILVRLSDGSVTLFNQTGIAFDQAAGFTLTGVRGSSGIVGFRIRSGTAALGAGGTVVINDTSITASTRIYAFPQETGVLTGILSVTARVVGTSFTISSSVNTDTVTFAWLLLEP